MTMVCIVQGKAISYDEASVFIGAKEVPKDEFDGQKPKDYAQSKMRSEYKALLSSQYENVLVLAGAGTSYGIGDSSKQGKTMAGLWTSVVNAIGFEKLSKFAQLIKFNDIQDDYTDLEVLLSQAYLAYNYSQDEKIVDIKKCIEEVIRSECELELPDSAPHFAFLRALTARKQKYARVKIFTLNYDLLFEKAAARGGYIVIDGFSFTEPREFNGTYFDYDIVVRNNNRILSEENFAPKVFHLYKPHGSLDWERIEHNGKAHFVKNSCNSQHPVMIFPSNAKFESSYEQPYFEMVSRFQQELRTKNVLLIVVGFSFSDKHINAMIQEALESNPSLTMLIVSPDACDTEKFQYYQNKAESLRNVMLISETFEMFAKNYPYPEIYASPVKEVVSSETI